MKSVTKAALQKFAELERAENRVHKLNGELTALVMQIPQEDIVEYAEKTGAIYKKTA